MPIGNPDHSEKMSVCDGLLFNYMIREREREREKEREREREREKERERELERERERVTCLSFLKQPSSKCFSQTMFCFEYLYVLMSRFFVPRLWIHC